MAELNKAPTRNILLESQMEEDKERIFELTIIYKTFSDHLQNLNNSEEKKNKDEGSNNTVYIISKDFTEEFKKKIKYEKTKELLVEDENLKEENLKKFKEFLKEYSYEELYSILCADIKLYSELEAIEEDISKGIDFVNYDFLDKLEFEDMDDYACKYYRNKENIFILFDDKSKLIINKEDGKYKYHGIPPPFEKKEDVDNKLKRTKTVSAYFSNRRSKTRKEGTKIDFKNKTIKEK